MKYLIRDTPSRRKLAHIADEASLWTGASHAPLAVAELAPGVGMWPMIWESTG